MDQSSSSHARLGYVPARDGLRVIAFLLGAGLFAAGLAFAVARHLTGEILPYDDAYISFRYAANLAAGRGLVYNPGEHVFGSTTPLYVLWLALLQFLTRSADLPTLAVRANLLFYVAAAIAVAGWTYQLSGRAWFAFLVGSIFTLHPEMIEISRGGMETFLLIALAVGGLWALADRHDCLSGIMIGLAAVTRPEGLFLLPIWGISWLLSNRKHKAPAAALAALPLAVWVVGATLAFGTPVPQSIVAKQAPLYLLPPGSALGQMVGDIVRWSGASSWSAPFGLPILGVALWLPISALALSLFSPLERHRVWPLAAFGALVLLFYAITNPLMFDWYAPLLWVLWSLMLLSGTLAWLNRLHRVPGSPLIPLGLLSALLFLAAAPFVELASPWTTSPERLRVTSYQEVAHWLNRTALTNATVAAPEIGALGYFYRGPILDTSGLVSLKAMPYLPVPMSQRIDGSVGAVSPALMKDLQPDYLVTMPVFIRKGLSEDPWFATQYALAESVPLPTPLWGDDRVLVFRFIGEDTHNP